MSVLLLPGPAGAGRSADGAASGGRTSAAAAESTSGAPSRRSSGRPATSAGRQHESEAHRRNSLFQIATNLARDSARHAARYKDVPLVTDEDDSPSATLSSDAPVPERQAAIRTDLQRAMKQLEPVQRELLWLAYAQGASHEEIAEITGLRAISIRTLLFRARKKLAALLNAGVTA